MLVPMVSYNTKHCDILCPCNKNEKNALIVNSQQNFKKKLLENVKFESFNGNDDIIIALVF